MKINLDRKFITSITLLGILFMIIVGFLLFNPSNYSQFQVIYRDDRREWALVPESGMSRVRPKFYDTWDQRVIQSIGGEDQVLDSVFSRIGSWSMALAIIEEKRNK